MRNIVLLFLAILFVSCNVLKVQDSLLDSYEESKVQGKVKSITLFSIVEKNKDSSKTILIYNGRALPQKEIDFLKNDTLSTTFTYNKNNLLAGRSIEKGKWASHYKYDNDNNMINYQQTREGELYVEKKFYYDKNNNKIKEIYLKPNELTGYNLI